MRFVRVFLNFTPIDKQVLQYLSLIRMLARAVEEAGVPEGYPRVQAGGNHAPPPIGDRIGSQR